MKILNQAIENTPVTELKAHPRNPRRGNVDSIRASIEKNGFYGAIIAQKSTGYILAGNHRYMVAKQSGADEIPVIWVDVDDDHALRILLADNRTNDLAEYDDSLLMELLNDLAESTGTLEGTGYDEGEIDELLSELAEETDEDTGLSENYSRKIEAPVYTPKGDRPSINELFDRSKADSLIKEVKAANLPKEVSEFLCNAAERHTIFYFDQIAEFYAHADAETQDLMERSALVIIDFNKAVELGYVKLTERMLEQAGYSKEFNQDA